MDDVKIKKILDEIFTSGARASYQCMSNENILNDKAYHKIKQLQINISLKDLLQLLK